MATLWITEYEQTAQGPNANGVRPAVPVPVEPAETDQTVTFTTATQSAAFGSDTNFVRLYASAACHVAFGANPTATASKQKLQADTEYWRAVTAGHKVSVYDGTS